MAMQLARAAGGAAGRAYRPGLALDPETARLVDLTHPFDDSTVYWPTARRFHLEPVAHGTSPGGWWYAANDFCAAEHGGTHLDAPIHFAEGGWTTDEIPLDRLRGPAVVIDVTSRAAADRDLLIRVDDLRAHEAIHGRIPDGAVVLLRTGWSSSLARPGELSRHRRAGRCRASSPFPRLVGGSRAVAGDGATRPRRRHRHRVDRSRRVEGLPRPSRARGSERRDLREPRHRSDRCRRAAACSWDCR